MDSMNHRHVTRVATGARTGAAVGVLVLVLSACAVSHHPALDRVRLTPPADHVLAGRLAAADVVVAGVLTRAQRDIRYEAPCGIIAHIMRRCDDTEAYDARIKAFDGHEWTLMFFRLGPGPHPAPGDSAVWVLHRDAVFPYLVCAQRAALTRTGCVRAPSFILESDDDMLPLREGPRVQRLLHALHLQVRAPPPPPPRPPLARAHPGAVSSPAGSGPGRLMSAKSLEKLRALLKGYAERTGAGGTGGVGAAGAAGAAGTGGTDVKPVHDESERRRRACGERLQKVVRAVLDRVVDELKNAGHEAAIEDQSATAGAYPSLELAFTPRSPAGTALTSVLTFRCDPRRGIAVARDIKPSPAKGRVVTTSSDRIGTMKVEAISVEWVETKTLSFIEAVLKVN